MPYILVAPWVVMCATALFFNAMSVQCLSPCKMPPEEDNKYRYAMLGREVSGYSARWICSGAWQCCLVMTVLPVESACNSTSRMPALPVESVCRCCCAVRYDSITSGISCNTLSCNRLAIFTPGFWRRIEQNIAYYMIGNIWNSLVCLAVDAFVWFVAPDLLCILPHRLNVCAN